MANQIFPFRSSSTSQNRCEPILLLRLVKDFSFPSGWRASYLKTSPYDKLLGPAIKMVPLLPFLMLRTMMLGPMSLTSAAAAIGLVLSSDASVLSRPQELSKTNIKHKTYTCRYFIFFYLFIRLELIKRIYLDMHRHNEFGL
ncbi:hypothetical protein D3C85_971390 [compost metagenome]